ncbi:hypothetical protein AS9A_P20077 (plasmid) [Hoyosella subflava DQS3-9A1]|uniref:Uncharacterized protein n=1 Tax=Hoyosella subflava (strain DSM 45089 / JCM 17490 / NBRC 109087 / DQS3-9A1) TaxID=443218 RepID=F6ESK0_HOYSD|nr:hypothetical protein AS9A_P20077 [Hoyosella subflava DQS3-9A1]
MIQKRPYPSSPIAPTHTQQSSAPGPRTTDDQNRAISRSLRTGSTANGCGALTAPAPSLLCAAAPQPRHRETAR